MEQKSNGMTTPKFNPGDVVVCISTLPNYKITIHSAVEHRSGWLYTNKEQGRNWKEAELELFDSNKKYIFTA